MSDLPEVLVESLEFRGKTYFVRELTGKGRAAVRKLLTSQESDEREAMLVALGLCDANGDLKYDASKPEDIAKLVDSSGGFLGAVVEKLFAVSGLAVKADEQAEKN